MRAILLGLLGVASIASAGPLPSTSRDPSDPKIRIPRPTRKLQWGDVNVLHTTDIHGWISGHSKEVYPEKNWSGDFGNFSSFVTHMRDIAKQRNSDLLLVDTGDRRFGHGLTDRVLAGGVNGETVSLLYRDIGYDLVVPGNHDLKNGRVAKWTKETLVKKWEDRYLTSNVVRTDERDKNGEMMPLGVRYRSWETLVTKKRMMAFGVVTHETNGRGMEDANLKAIPIGEMIEQKWFKNAIRPNEVEPVDVFVLLGHVDPQLHRTKLKNEDNIKLIHDAIREEHPVTPILIFTGHTHQLWCESFQNEAGHRRSMLLQSGQYFETVGWMSVELDDNKTPGDLTFSRRYLDNNVQTYMYHAGFDLEDVDGFKTELGKNVTSIIQGLAESVGLSDVIGWLGSDYFLDRSVWSEYGPKNGSLFAFYLDAVDRTLIDHQKSPNWIFFSNWGMVRGDLYRGPVTMGDLYAISPDASDTSPFLYARVSREDAESIMGKVREMGKKTPSPVVQESLPESLDSIIDNSQSRFSSFAPGWEQLTYGRKTTDLCGDHYDGDDVPHKKIPRVDFDHPKDGLPVYFWRKSYESWNLNPKDEVDFIVPTYLRHKNVKEAIKALKLDVEFEAYRQDVNQNNLLENYIRGKFPPT